MPSVREKRPGYWEVRVYVGRDPITGKGRPVAGGLRGTTREATRLGASLITDLSHHPVVDTEGTVADTCTEVIDHLEQIGRHRRRSRGTANWPGAESMITLVR